MPIPAILIIIAKYLAAAAAGYGLGTYMAKK